MSIAFSRGPVYEWGTRRADDIPTAPLTYVPLGADGQPAEVAAEPWTAEECAEWAAAEMADSLAGRDL